MSDLDRQIRALQNLTRRVFAVAEVLERLKLHGSQAALLEAACVMDHEQRELQRRRGNAHDVLEDARFERVWRQVMARVDADNA